MEKLYNILAEYKYISFDLFDTLLFRSVDDPKDVFDLVELSYNSQEDVSKRLNGFKYNRIEAERIARQKCIGEVTIDEIYNEIDVDGDIAKLEEIEKYIEINNCIINYPMKKILDRCVDDNKKILITTDMYLDRNTIESILKRLDIKYDLLFISSEVRKTKNKGDLFELLLSELEIKPNEIVHIGDNIRNDIEMPRRYGIKSFERVIENFDNDCLRYISKDNHIMNRHFKNRVKCFFMNGETKSTESILGYSVVGPFLKSYCEWVHRQKYTHNIQKLLFVAREGYLLKRCYEIMYPSEKDCLEYVYLNRNTMRFPALNKMNNPVEVIQTLPFNNCTWRQILNVFDIEYNSKEYDIFVDKYSDLIMDNYISKRELTNKDNVSIIEFIIGLVKEKIDEQTQLLDEYLMNIELDGKRIGLVNNSYNGTCQIILERILERNGYNTKCLGLQFVKSPKCDEVLKDRSLAWFDSLEMPKHYSNEFASYSILFEHLLFDKEGTGLRFYSKNGNVCIENAKLENEANNFIVVSSIQEYALKYVQDCIHNIAISNYNNYYETITMINLLNAPKENEARLLGGLYDDDVDGSKAIVDFNVKFRAGMCLGRNIPYSIKWVQGYFKIAKKKRLCGLVYRVNNMRICYNNNIIKLISGIIRNNKDKPMY